SGGLITAIDLPSSSSISWTLNGVGLNMNSNPFNIGQNQLSGYFYGTITNEFGCTSNTDSLLQIFPSFNLSQTQGCGPLSIQANNTTPSFNGMTCVLQSNGVNYPIDNFTALNYSIEGAYNTSLTCSLDGSIFTASGPSVTVFPNAPTPVLSWAYGAVLCSNCSGLSTQYFLDDIAFAQGSTAVSTLQNGVYQNGYYTAQSSSAQGCLSSVSLPVLVIQPVLNFTPSEGCAPLQSTFVNSTDYVEGLSCELFLGNGSGNIPLSYLETYSYSYSNPNTYSPYLSCTAGNTVANSPSASLVVNGGTTPELIFDAGFVNCANCANQDNITWIIDGTLTIDSISSVPDSLGSFFSCDYTNEFGCIANSFIVSVIEEDVSTFNLFPNPVRDQLNITGLAQTSTLEIRDAQGRLVYQDLGRGASRTINTSEFSNGFYTITETSSKIFRSGTLLVNH
ncbi:MAG: T9SS type A sorting domain-containing protein, partial [Flavobacteriales bacterium]|nr:T9SS type A sorting domain-containing protein [Flavobacteriales bacterium]